MFPSRKSAQAGFTLIEILVALALITLLAVGIALTFDGTRSRAQTLLNTMTDLASANVRFKNDTGCYADVPAVLFDQSRAATTSTNFCTRSLTSTWNGPYVAPFTVNGSGLVALEKVSSGVVLDFTRDTSTAGGANFANGGKKYVVSATGLPADVVTAALLECNGSDADVAQYTGKCIGSSTAGTFSMMFDETR